MRSDGPTPALWPPPESLRPTLVGSRFAVSAGHPLVADVAVRVLHAGGNAVDAGVAGGLAANVVQSDMCNFGGVAPLLVRAAGDEVVHSVAGLGTWGTGATVEAYRERYGAAMPPGGPCAIVPGAPAAWIAALKRFGTWSFADVAAPAIAYAREGFPLDLRLAQSLEVMGPAFASWPSSRSIYWPADRPPRTGELLVQDDLGRLLERLAAAETGATRADALTNVHKAFYEGEVAERIVRWVVEDGGWMILDDLARFEAEITPAVSTRYGGWEINVTDTWTQGPALLQMLNILGGIDVAALGHNSADYLHVLAEVMRLAFADRERYYGDPRQVDVPLDWLLSEAHADDLRAQIRPTYRGPKSRTSVPATAGVPTPPTSARWTRQVTPSAQRSATPSTERRLFPAWGSWCHREGSRVESIQSTRRAWLPASDLG